VVAAMVAAVTVVMVAAVIRTVNGELVVCEERVSRHRVLQLN
jgi:hypothetical protein